MGRCGAKSKTIFAPLGGVARNEVRARGGAPPHILIKTKDEALVL